MDLVYQGMIDKIKTIEQPDHPSYNDKEKFDCQLLLDKNQYTDLNSLHICFPVRFRKAKNGEPIDMTIAPVNNVFAHGVKEINIIKYGTNKQLIPTSTPQEIYQYSDAMLRHLPEKYSKKLRKHVLFSEKEVIYTAGVDRRLHNDDNANKRSDDNLDDRIAKFSAQIQNKFTYRIPLHYLCDLDLEKLFETNKKVDNIGVPDAQIVLLKVPYLQYEQIVLAKNFRQYLESILFSPKVLRMGVRKTPYLKTFELQTSTQDFSVDFIGANR